MEVVAEIANRVAISNDTDVVPVEKAKAENSNFAFLPKSLAVQCRRITAANSAGQDYAE